MPAAGAWVLTGGAWKRKGRTDRTPPAAAIPPGGLGIAPLGTAPLGGTP